MANVALGQLNSATISNSGAVDIHNVGDAAQNYALSVTSTGSESFSVGTMTTNGHAITLSVTDSIGAIDAGAISATAAANVAITLDTTADATLAAVTGNAVTIDAGDVVGTTTYGGAITAKGDVTLTGTAIDANDWAANGVTLTGVSQTISVTGGLGDDDIDITGSANQTSVTMTGDLDAGTNSVTLDVSASGEKVTVDLSDLASYTASTLTGSAQNDTVTGGAKADAYTTSGGSDSFTGGDGADTLTIDTDFGSAGVTFADFDSSETDAIEIDIAASVTTTGTTTALSAYGLGVTLLGTDGAGGTSETVATGTATTSTSVGSNLTGVFFSGTNYKSFVAATTTTVTAGTLTSVTAFNFAVLFLDTDGEDAGLYLLKGSKTGIGTTTTANMSITEDMITQTIKLVLTGGNDVAASDISLV
jgi:hypothetical protein